MHALGTCLTWYLIALSKTMNVGVFVVRLPFTAWKVSKCGVISGPYFTVFSPNTGKYGPEITPHLGTFHAVFLNIS